jgi:hypothetical protein
LKLALALGFWLAEKTKREEMADAGTRKPESWLSEFGSGKPAGVPGTAVMACRAFKIQAKADKDPLYRGSNGVAGGRERTPETGFRGRNPKLR